MTCKIDGCCRKIMYKAQSVCQMHYFRFMRNGIYETILSRKYRITNPAGYQKIFEPDHFLANSDGYVYEHRFIVFNQYGHNLPDCEICGDTIKWDTCHIDHIDEDVTNNNMDNIRPVCRGCNTGRTERACNLNLTVRGKTKSVSAWAKDPGVKVCRSTIIRRKMNGLSDYNALYMDKITHK